MAATVDSTDAAVHLAFDSWKRRYYSIRGFVHAACRRPCLEVDDNTLAGSALLSSHLPGANAITDLKEHILSVSCSRSIPSPTTTATQHGRAHAVTSSKRRSSGHGRTAGCTMYCCVTETQNARSSLYSCPREMCWLFVDGWSHSHY